MTTVHVARTSHLDAATLYRILALRTDVFVVEQNCPYPELDGRDLEPATRQLWIGEGTAIRATLRLLRDEDGSARIGRVATAASARGQGLAAALMTRALELCAGTPVVLDAQAHLEGWYARFGFARSGAPFVEDGIDHVPMRREADPDETAPREAALWQRGRSGGGEAYAELVEAQRLLMDRVSGAAPDEDALPALTEALREVTASFEAFQVPEQQRMDGMRIDLPGRGAFLLPPYRVDTATDSSVAGTVRFPRFWLGAGAAVHGGSHSLLFDDVLGFLAARVDGPCRTAYLKLNYRRITPLDLELGFEGTLDRVDGRKRFVSGRLRNPAGQVVADAEGLFLQLLEHHQ